MKKELTPFEARSAGRYLAQSIRRAVRQSWQHRSTCAAVIFAGTVAAGISAPVQAQQTTGSIKGTVSAVNGVVSVSGVSVEATSNVMPKPRTATTKTDGSFTLPFLLPGDYDVKFTFADGSVRTLKTRVLLDQSAVVNLVYEPANTEVIEIVGSPIIQEGDSSLTNSFSQELIAAMPIGQTYRDMLKILPGIEYSENSVLGPSAGGSGVDNSYGFDGVDLSLPMFGNLSSEPSTHDIAYVSVDRGGAKAIGFNRSGGFAVNSVSKSGTNEFHGNVEYRIQNADFSATPKSGVIQDTDRTWIITSLSGPLIEDELFFYASYYRPEVDGTNKVTVYGPAKKYNSTRDEFFGKLTWAPNDDLLINLSQRVSNREIEGASIGEFETDSVSLGSSADLSILSLDGSYLLSDTSSFTFKYGMYQEDTASRPDVMLSAVPSIGGSLDLNNLDQMGYFGVPSLRDIPAGADADTIAAINAYNAAALPLIQAYGYVGDSGEMMGGTGVGAYPTINNQDFERESLELAYDTELELGDMTHFLHFGFKWSEIMEDLARLSNGWGTISYVGGLGAEGDNDVSDVYYQVAVEQMSLVGEDGTVPTIKSFAESYSFEINDEIEHGDFTYNIGVLVSKDILYGQGLKKNSSNVSGYELAPGEKYEMYEVDWKDMIQPRLGVTWDYDASGSVFANYASYNPEASSLARAASWDRNSRRTILVNFDENGDYLSAGGAAGSSGKFFADNMKPRRIDELTVGATKLVTPELFLRTHLRYRYGSHFWEDMPNDARLYGDYTGGSVPDNIAAKGLYIPNLADMRAEVGGSSYVIAEVDGGQTKYYEWSMEAEYNADNLYVNASYTWSHYYGNFDQDNTTAGNDANTFIGSSFYGDGPGRMVWDNRYGKLIGDKPHKFKVLSTYTFPWEGVAGAYFIFQSGEAWTAWDGALYGYSSSTSRYAEPAGSRRGASHWQMDLSYTQNYEFMDGLVGRFRADLFNVFDKQTGYSYDPYPGDNFGSPRSYYNPRRIQLSVGLSF
ncbi:carboxypeptidase regulatory-like domain-containing protein [Aestuariibacter sp. GS-14]|uniref:TonB-dependent receptor n=1 Tax=Aestuariibacter sp. GS-14 TaxID=2590670 RepID=UPI0015E87039|nr:carboxypeptidase regulatory-like domain-containing protein [Aestuariibacter sp. GS-14]